MYCRNCGSKISDGSRFCQSCGAPQTEDAAMPGNKTQKERWESVSLKVETYEEKSIIEEREHFGWELVSSQTVDTTDSHLERRFGDLYSVTECENYVKIVFRRNKNIAHYREIVNLEEEYYELKNRYEIPAEPEKPKKPSGYKNISGLLSCILSPVFIPRYLRKIKPQYEKQCEEYEKQLAEYNVEYERWRNDVYGMAVEQRSQQIQNIFDIAEELLAADN